MTTNDTFDDTATNWPGGHRAAVAIVVAVGDAIGGSAASAPDAGIDYAATGLQRLLDTLADLDLRVTTCWTEEAMNSQPQLLRRIGDQGHEIAAAFAPGEVASADSSLVAALRRVSGQPVNGACTATGPHPGLVPDANGFLWQIGGSGCDLPSVAGSNAGDTPTVHIPISPYWIDRAWLHPDRPLPPSSLLETWSTSLAAVRTGGTLMTVVIHPHIMPRPGFAGVFVRFLDEIIASGDVWLTRLDLLATWWRERTVTGQP